MKRRPQRAVARTTRKPKAVEGTEAQISLNRTDASARHNTGLQKMPKAPPSEPTYCTKAFQSFPTPAKWKGTHAKCHEWAEHIALRLYFVNRPVIGAHIAKLCETTYRSKVSVFCILSNTTSGSLSWSQHSFHWSETTWMVLLTSLEQPFCQHAYTYIIK